MKTAIILHTNYVDGTFEKYGLQTHAVDFDMNDIDITNSSNFRFVEYVYAVKNFDSIEDLLDFKETVDEELIISNETNYTSKMDKLLEKEECDFIIEIYDDYR